MKLQRAIRMGNIYIYQMWKNKKACLFQLNILIILKHDLKEELKFTHLSLFQLVSTYFQKKV